MITVHVCTYNHSRNPGSGEPRCLKCGQTEAERAENELGAVTILSGTHARAESEKVDQKLPDETLLASATTEASVREIARQVGAQLPEADPVGFELPFWFKYLDPTDMHPEDLPKYLKFAAQIPGDPQGLLEPGVGGVLFDLRPDEIERAEGWIEQFAMPMGASHWRLDPTQAWVIARYAKWLRGDL